MFYIFVNLLTILIIFLLQFSFFNVLIFPFNTIFLFLAIPIFIMVMVKNQLSYFWLAVLALILEFFSSSVFLLAILAFLTTIIIIQFLIYRIFTHKSIYSLFLLTCISVIIYTLIMLLGNYVGFMFKLPVSDVLINISKTISTMLWTCFLNCIFNLFLYLVSFDLIFKKYNILL